MLGKSYRKSVVSASEDISLRSSNEFVRKNKLWNIVGYGANFSSILLLSFYSVISGWVLFFTMQYLFKLFSNNMVTSETLNILQANTYLQIGLLSAHLLVTSLVVSLGLKQVVEKLSTVVMPLFTALMIFLVFKSISLPGAEAALRFLFYPNFSEVTADTFIRVLGHVFFTLSVGMGAMVVFGGYLQSQEYVPRTAFKIAVLEITVSLFIGLLIFPALFNMEQQQDMGPNILFKILPYLFETIGLGKLFGVFFFICFYVAVLSASIMLLETSVANLIERRKAARTKTAWMITGVTFVLALPVVLSDSWLKDVRYFDLDILKLYDKTLVETILPLVVLGMALLVGYGMTKEKKEAEFVHEEEIDSDKLFRNWMFLIRWFVPIVTIFAIVISFLF